MKMKIYDLVSQYEQKKIEKLNEKGMTIIYRGGHIDTVIEDPKLEEIIKLYIKDKFGLNL